MSLRHYRRRKIIVQAEKELWGLPHWILSSRPGPEAFDPFGPKASISNFRKRQIGDRRRPKALLNFYNSELPLRKMKNLTVRHQRPSTTTPTAPDPRYTDPYTTTFAPDGRSPRRPTESRFPAGRTAPETRSPALPARRVGTVVCAHRL